jgi:hypothetical protein
MSSPFLSIYPNTILPYISLPLQHRAPHPLRDVSHPIAGSRPDVPPDVTAPPLPLTLDSNEVSQRIAPVDHDSTSGPTIEDTGALQPTSDSGDIMIQGVGDVTGLMHDHLDRYQERPPQQPRWQN